jgi:23S rRNA (uracil1939-C5)-methyltransferase
VALLDLRPQERVLELFSGLGNFSLPLARRVARVVTVEGDAGLVERARRNAALNGLANIEHHVADLGATTAGTAWLAAEYDAVLVDPPRTGAREILQLAAARKPRRILYVSCHPGTLARDAGPLVQGHGYRLRAAGIMDMFPHTSHVESMALFEAG